MIKLSVIAKTHYNVNLDIESFDEICTDKMSLEDSDELIRNAIQEQHGECVDDIISVNLSKFK